MIYLLDAKPRIDTWILCRKNRTMKTNEEIAIPPDVAADMQVVINSLMTGQPLDPETARRIRERGEKITERLRQQYGELDIGVPAIRELRGDLPK